MNVAIPAITPYLVRVGCELGAVEFYTKGRLARCRMGRRTTMPGGGQDHACSRLVINGGLVMLADDFSEMMGTCKSETPESLGGSPITLALQMDDVQSFWDRAVAGWGDGGDAAGGSCSGATGMRMVVDPYGHKWSMSQTIKVMDDAEMQKAAEEQMGDKGSLRGEKVT